MKDGGSTGYMGAYRTKTDMGAHTEIVRKKRHATFRVVLLRRETV